MMKPVSVVRVAKVWEVKVCQEGDECLHDWHPK